MLGRFGLQLAGRTHHRHKGYVHIKGVVAAHIVAHLSNRLEERHGLNIANRATDFDDDHVDVVALGDLGDPALDLVGDMRDDLNGLTQIVATPLLADDFVIHLAASHVASLGQIFVDKALVMADIQVGLGTILGDKHLAVLIWRHRPRIDIQIRIQLLNRHAQTARLEHSANGRGGDPFPHRTDYATRTEYVFWHTTS